jgi:hypothetical protein
VASQNQATAPPCRLFRASLDLIQVLVEKERSNSRVDEAREFKPEGRQGHGRSKIVLGSSHDSWRVLRCGHERRAGRGKMTKLR